MKTQFVRINKLVTGSYAYNKLTFPVGTIFQLISDNGNQLEFCEIGRPNVQFVKSRSLYAEGTFEIVDFLSNEDLENLGKALIAKVQTSLTWKEQDEKNREILYKMLDRM